MAGVRIPRANEEGSWMPCMRAHVAALVAGVRATEDGAAHTAPYHFRLFNSLNKHY